MRVYLSNWVINNVKNETAKPIMFQVERFYTYFIAQKKLDFDM